MALSEAFLGVWRMVRNDSRNPSLPFLESFLTIPGKGWEASCRGQNIFRTVF